MYYKRDKEKGWCLEEVKKVAAPILALKYIDMRCDGIKDLVVLSMKGVHVLQVKCPLWIQDLKRITEF